MARTPQIAAGASRYWRPAGLEGVDLFWSEASRHQFPRHSHEGYALGAVEQGAHALAARGRGWVARPGDVITVNPEDTHDGGPPGRNDTYTYRVIYLDAAALRRIASELRESRVETPFFTSAVVTDPELARQVARLHASYEAGNSRLENESRLLATALGLLWKYAKTSVEPAPGRHADAPVERVREYLEAHLAEDVSLAGLAILCGLNRFRLVREFRRRFGLPPHAYQTQLRLRRVRRLLLAGEPAAEAALAAGFADQSHMIRKFKAVYGVTPGQYRGTRNNVQSGLSHRA